MKKHKKMVQENLRNDYYKKKNLKTLNNKDYQQQKSRKS